MDSADSEHEAATSPDPGHSSQIPREAPSRTLEKDSSCSGCSMLNIRRGA
jgi:hypothetical protein